MKKLRMFFEKFDQVVMSILPYMFELILFLATTAGIIWCIKTILKLLGVL